MSEILVFLINLDMILMYKLEMVDFVFQFFESKFKILLLYGLFCDCLYSCLVIEELVCFLDYFGVEVKIFDFCGFL